MQEPLAAARLPRLGAGTGGERRGGEGLVTWLGLGGGGGGSVPRQQVHQQLSLPAPRGVGVEVGVGVGEDVGEAAAYPRYCPVSVPSPGPGHGTHAVLAFTPPQPFSRDKTNGQAGAKQPRSRLLRQVQAHWVY